MMRELRYALRSLGRSPGFVAVAVLSLGLGLGLVTTMFAILDATTHPWVPYRDPDRLYVVRYWLSGADVRYNAAWVLTALRERTHSFEAILPYRETDLDLSSVTGSLTAENPLYAAEAPPAMLTVLGMKARLGRLLVEADVGRGTCMVSEELWRRLFAGRRTVAGATLGRTCTVVGVVPSGGASWVLSPSAWFPMPDTARAGSFSAIMVKLRPGVTRAAANAELAAVAAYLTKTYHTEAAPFAFYIWPLRNDPLRLGDVHWAMLGSAVAVLLIACANLANLMLARGLAKRREVALRLAIGASRAAVVRQLFVECALLTLVGAALGSALSVWGVDVLRTSVPQQLWWRGIVRPMLSWRVYALTCGAAAASAVLFGLLPAVRVARAVSLDEPLKDGAGTTARTRQRFSPLVIAEVALSLVLLMGAGLLLKVVHRTASYEFNFPARQLLRSGIFLRRTPAAHGAVAGPDLLATELRVVESVRRVPAVVDAAALASAPVPGFTVAAELDGGTTRLFNNKTYALVTPEYLRTMGLPVLEGRDFEAGDLGGTGVAILNTVAAARLYPGGRVAGRMIKLGPPASAGAWLPVVGVCRTLSEGPPGTAQFDPEVYVVGGPPQPRLWSADVVIRASKTDARTIAAIGAQLTGLGPGVGRYVIPYLSWWEAEIRSQGFLAELFAMMGGFALLLASVGIYGVLAYAVSRRVREFAVRIAVGAERRDMLKLVLHDGLVMALAGTALGGFVALWATGFLSAFLEDQQVQPTDVLTLVVSETVLIAVATAASLAPALRAMRADPIEILRAT